VMLGTTSVFLMQTPAEQPIDEYFQLAKAGRAAEASRKYYELQPLRDCWTSMYASLWNQKGATHPLPWIKHWMDLIGMYGGPVRPPMHPLTAEQKAELTGRLEASGWLDRLVPGRTAQRRVA
jgi:4-hydroxy-tetrahydrodipicolinate synthase